MYAHPLCLYPIARGKKHLKWLLMLWRKSCHTRDVLSLLDSAMRRPGTTISKGIRTVNQKRWRKPCANFLLNRKINKAVFVENGREKFGKFFPPILNKSCEKMMLQGDQAPCRVKI